MIFDIISFIIVLISGFFMMTSLCMLVFDKFGKDIFIIFIVSTMIFFPTLYFSNKKMTNDNIRNNTMISNTKYITKYFTDDRYGDRSFYFVYDDGEIEVLSQEYYKAE